MARKNEEKNESQPEEIIAERVTLRRESQTYYH